MNGLVLRHQDQIRARVASDGAHYYCWAGEGAIPRDWMLGLSFLLNREYRRVISVPEQDGTWLCLSRTVEPRSADFWDRAAIAISNEPRFTPRILAEAVAYSGTIPEHAVPVFRPNLIEDPLHASTDPEALSSQVIACTCGTVHSVVASACPRCNKSNLLARLLVAQIDAATQHIDEKIALSFRLDVDHGLYNAVQDYGDRLMWCTAQPFPVEQEKEETNAFMSRVRDYFRSVLEHSSPLTLSRTMPSVMLNTAWSLSQSGWTDRNELVEELTGARPNFDKRFAERQVRRVQKDLLVHFGPFVKRLKAFAPVYMQLVAKYGPVHKIFSRDNSFKLGKFLWDALRSAINPIGAVIRIGASLIKDKFDQEKIGALDTALSNHLTQAQSLADKIRADEPLYNQLMDTYRLSLRNSILSAVVREYKHTEPAQRPQLVQRAVRVVRAPIVQEAWQDWRRSIVWLPLVLLILFSADHGIRAIWFTEQRSRQILVRPEQVETRKKPDGKEAKIRVANRRKPIAVFSSERGWNKVRIKRKRFRVEDGKTYKVIREGQRRTLLAFDNGVQGWVDNRRMETGPVFKTEKQVQPAQYKTVVDQALAFERIGYNDALLEMKPLWVCVVGLLLVLVLLLVTYRGLGAATFLLFVAEGAGACLFVGLLRYGTINWIVV